MTGLSLLPLFLLACAGGYIAVGRRGGTDIPVWRAGIGGPAAIMLVGTLIAAAEVGSAAARYLSLFAVLSASAGAVMILGVMERHWPPIDLPGDDEDAA